MKKKSILFGLLIVVSFIFTMKVNAASIRCTPTSVYVGDQITCTISDVADDEEVSVTTSLNRVSGKTTITKSDVDNGDNNIVYSAKSTGTYNITAKTTDWTSNPVRITVSEKTTTTTTTTTTKSRSSNNYLSSITIDGEEIDDFSKNTTRYFIEVENDVTKVSIDAQAEDDLSTVEIDGPNSLDVGDNEFTISVTSEDNTTKFYKVIVTRKDEEESSNTSIKSIDIKGYNLNFNKNARTFYLTINKNDTKLDIDIDLNDKTSSYEIEGNKNLKDGSEIRIIVTAEDDSTDTYRIIIQKKDTNYVPLIIGIVTLVIIIIIVIVLINKKNKNNKNDKIKDINKNTETKKEVVKTTDNDQEKTKQMPSISSDTLTNNVDENNDYEDDDHLPTDNDEEEETRMLSYAERVEVEKSLNASTNENEPVDDLEKTKTMNLSSEIDKAFYDTFN